MLNKVALKFILPVAGVYLLLGLILVFTDFIHGINDQDFSFLISITVYYLSLPAVWALKALGFSTSIITTVIAGTIQWGFIGLLIGGIFYSIKGTEASSPAQEQQEQEGKVSQ